MDGRPHCRWYDFTPLWVVVPLLAIFFAAGTGIAEPTRPARAANRPPLLSYRDSQGRDQPVKTAEDWAIRRRQIQQGMEAAMGPLPDRAKLPPLDVQISERYECDGFMRLALSYASGEGDRVPAYLFLPRGRPGRHAAVLALHQTTPIGKRESAGLGGAANLHYAVELARRGYVVLVPDYPSLGDYRYDFHRSKYASGSMKGIVNHIRGVDLLCGLAEVDPGRIGAIGHSLGGHNAMFLAAFDSRIKAVVSSCGWTPLADYHGGKLDGWAGERYMPRLRTVYGLDPGRAPFDFDEVVAAIAPRAFFSNSPLRDDNFAVAGVRKTELKAREVFTLLRASDQFVVRYPDSAHDFPPEVRQEAYAFLDRVLCMNDAANSGALPDLQVGTAFPAFDHLGAIAHQAKAAAACGATVLYATGLGGEGYSGLPDAVQWAERRRAAAAYVREAKALGIRLVLGYLCATSIVDLPHFDAHWDPSFRARLHTPPSAWRQQDRNGRPLPSWYGGAYEPACMNNPDWRTYERYMIEQQLEAGHDGVFFDNPVVHSAGCFCPHCMERFARFLRDRRIAVPDTSLTGLRRTADARPKEFRQFRATIAADFFAEMRAYAKSIRPGALLTANNSLNSPDVLYKQCRESGCDIHAMSENEDFVTIEDMVSQPRTLPDGRAIEYGPTYEQLRAIVHGKPLVVCTLAEADYHTPPLLTRLAMAEGAAHGASYLLWSTWPEEVRGKMIAAVRPEVDLLAQHRQWLAAAQPHFDLPRCDVVLFLPWRGWIESDVCRASALAAELSRANLQYDVVCEDYFELPRLKRARALLVESISVLTPQEKATAEEFRRAGGAVIAADTGDWLQQIRLLTGVPAVALRGPVTVRAVVRDQPQRTLVHLLNLNVSRRSSFQDDLHPAENVRLTVRVPFRSGCSVRVVTADTRGTLGNLPADFHADSQGGTVEFAVPRLDVAAFLVLEPGPPK
jgi:acetyl esterase/lipase